MALLVDAKHHSLVRRIEIEPDDVAQLLDKEGIGRELKTAGTVRLQTEELEQAMNRAFGNSRLLGDGAHAPMVAVLGLRASVLVISSATASSSTVRGLPVRISS
ncbi:hypothetical protein [Bradyrhizobium ivorense]|uniref:hypothetical protein n=1 Tax=Bradyrhizobium ivorense TaxID=2511166 RepID=UPI003D322625